MLDVDGNETGRQCLAWKPEIHGDAARIAMREVWHNRVFGELQATGIVRKEDWFQGCLLVH